MENEKGKIVKVTFEYENVKESLSGEQAEKWLEKVNGMCVSLQIRNQNPFQDAKFEWVVES